MRAVFEDVELLKGEHSFVAYSFAVPFFEFKWHYHPEFELTLIKKGRGQRIVGDSHQSFAENDLVLLGSGLPHTWFTDPGACNSEAVVIQFSENFLENFIKLTEFRQVHELLQEAKHGIFFQSDETIIQRITDLPQKETLFRITELLSILQLLAAKERHYLSSKDLVITGNTKTQNRINKVCQYVQTHSHEKINIEQVAGMAYLSKSAFCKFFKRVMKTNFSDYVNDIRIANACRWLTSSDNTIKEIALDTGFESLTYFNRIFLKKKRITPSEFRKRMRE